jgi:hypothetical protein
MKPDASARNPAPDYLRGLIEQAGISQREAAELIGIEPRLLRYYLTDPASGKQFRVAPYPVQFALECLAPCKEG